MVNTELNFQYWSVTEWLLSICWIWANLFCSLPFENKKSLCIWIESVFKFFFFKQSSGCFLQSRERVGAQFSESKFYSISFSFLLLVFIICLIISVKDVYNSWKTDLSYKISLKYMYKVVHFCSISMPGQPVMVRQVDYRIQSHLQPHTDCARKLASTEMAGRKLAQW